MKQILTIISLVIINISASAQNIHGSYQLKADVQVKKQQVEHLQVEPPGENVEWDFSVNGGR